MIGAIKGSLDVGHDDIDPPGDLGFAALAGTVRRFHDRTWVIELARGAEGTQSVAEDHCVGMQADGSST